MNGGSQGACSQGDTSKTDRLTPADMERGGTCQNSGKKTRLSISQLWLTVLLDPLIRTFGVTPSAR